MRSTFLCIFEPLRDALLTHDYYMHLGRHGGRRAGARGIYQPIAGARKAILNVAGLGKALQRSSLPSTQRKSGHHYVEFQRKSKLERVDHNQSQVILLGSRSWLP